MSTNQENTREDAARRYAQIEGERDYYKRRCERLEDERDALSANVERLREGLHQALIHWGSHCTVEDGAAYAECERRCNEIPATSLARREAEVAAHTAQQIQWNVAADCVGHEALKPSVVLGWLSDYAVTYRRQAEREDQ